MKSEIEKIMWGLLILFLICFNLFIFSRRANQKVPDIRPGPRMLSENRLPADGEQFTEEATDSPHEIGFDDYLAKRTAQEIIKSQPVPLGVRFWKTVFLKAALATLDELDLHRQENMDKGKPKNIAAGNAADGGRR